MKRFELHHTQICWPSSFAADGGWLWPFVTLSCAVALFTYILPKLYVSDTLILIRPPAMFPTIL